VDASRAAELQVLLEGVPLPAEKATLLAYAVQQHAEPVFIDALRTLPERQYVSIDDVAEELLHVHPPPQSAEPPPPREESSGPPGGDAYTEDGG
jgi:hypothetical protein